MEKRAEIIIYGRVQKAGFRDFIDETAFNLNLNGYVRNLEDGTVKVVCEGGEDLISEFLDKINIVQYPIRVTSIEITYKEPTGEYKSFEIIRDEDLTAAVYEKMDVAVKYMREMNSNLGNKIDQNNAEIRDMNSNLGNKIDQNNAEIRDMNSNLGNKIDQNNTEIRDMNSNLGQKLDATNNKIDLSRTEITSEIRLNREDFRSHIDERITKIKMNCLL
jgi:acylphosphatase